MRPKARIFQVFTYTADRISDEPYKKLGLQLMIKGYSVATTLQKYSWLYGLCAYKQSVRWLKHQKKGESKA